MSLQTREAQDLLHEIYVDGLIPTEDSEQELSNAYGERGEHRCDALFPQDEEMREVYWVAYTLRSMLEQHRLLLNGLDESLSAEGIQGIEIDGQTVTRTDKQAQFVLQAAIDDLDAIINQMETGHNEDK